MKDIITTIIIIGGNLAVLIFIGWLIYRYILYKDRKNKLIDAMTEKVVDSIDFTAGKAKKQQASTPIDCTGINFDRCSEAEFEAKVKELREITEGKEAG